MGNDQEHKNSEVFMSLYIDRDLKQAIRVAAAERGMSMSKLVTTMLRQAFLSKSRKENR